MLTAMLRTAVGLAAAALFAACVSADGAPLGSPDFQPSPDHPVGWRGDGSGQYPGATPPVHWGRAAKSVKMLRSQATLPAPGETGKPIPDGVIREWLILGPVPVPDDRKRLDKDLLPDEAKMEPREGEKVGDAAWRKVSTESQTLNFRELLGVEKQTQSAAYAWAWVYCESAESFHVNVMSSGHRLLVNGEPPKGPVNLQKGWNRMLFRVASGIPAEYGAGPEPLWYLRPVFYGAAGSETESENIAWRTDLPGSGISIPVIVGDRIFVATDRRSLICLDKKDGRLLWSRTLTLYDVATEEEKKAHPDEFKEIEPLAAKLKEYDQLIKPGAAVGESIFGRYGPKLAAEDKIVKLMAKVDPAKYAVFPLGEGGVSAPTPTSDGRNIYVAFLPYLVACFDADGKTQWVHMHLMDPPYKGAESHGMYNSPLLLDGKLFVQSDCLFALDARTGKPVWRNAPASKDAPVQTASPTALTVGREPLVVLPMNVVRARDGKVLSFSPGNAYYGCLGTPVIADGKIFRLFTRGDRPGMTTADCIRLPASAAEPFKAELEKGVAIDDNKFPRWFGGWTNASPLYHDGLLYCLSEDGVLTVVDTRKTEIVYQKMLDLDLEMTHTNTSVRGGACASPTLAGNYIYIFGNHGTCIVMEPGRTFSPVARNRIDIGGYPEITSSCPVFEGKRLYFRGTTSVYCIEEK